MYFCMMKLDEEDDDDDDGKQASWRGRKATHNTPAGINHTHHTHTHTYEEPGEEGGRAREA